MGPLLTVATRGRSVATIALRFEGIAEGFGGVAKIDEARSTYDWAYRGALQWRASVRHAPASANPSEVDMPCVNVQILEGASREQKACLVQDITASPVRELGKRPEHIHVVIQGVAEETRASRAC